MARRSQLQDWESMGEFQLHREVQGVTVRSALVRHDKLWHMEAAGLTMGAIEAYGVGEWDYCDKCNRAVPKSEGVMERIDGQSILFFCYRCAK